MMSLMLSRRKGMLNLSRCSEAGSPRCLRTVVIHSLLGYSFVNAANCSSDTLTSRTLEMHPTILVAYNEGPGDGQAQAYDTGTTIARLGFGLVCSWDLVGIMAITGFSLRCEVDIAKTRKNRVCGQLPRWGPQLFQYPLDIVLHILKVRAATIQC